MTIARQHGNPTRHWTNPGPLWPAVVVFVVALGGYVAAVSAQEVDEERMKRKRLDMVERQIQKRGVKDERVLRAMERVPRHHFVTPESIEQAYDDHPLRIGYEQTISQPYIVALMTELAGIGPDEKVLEIGTGSGYQAAVLSELALEVFSIEIVEPLGREAAVRLDALGYDNVMVRIGDGYQGWPEEAPFDAIVVTAAPEEIPPKLVEQLAEGGKMVVPVGTHYQELMLLEKKGGKMEKRAVTAVRFVPMVHGDDEKEQ